MNMIAAAAFMFFIYLVGAAIASLPAFLLAFFLPASRPWLRYTVTIIVFTLLVTPSLGSATIAVVPVAFAVYLVSTIISLDPSALVWPLKEWPLWHAIAFPLTLLVAVIIFRRLRPNNSFKPTPLRGAA